ncbi:MAG: RNA 3'-terminal phosphate cyclase [Nanoarchaeota archaeon]|nr:RNA 3'-terminal phosphate cyclase [Nanoarchaeota archaeon]
MIELDGSFLEGGGQIIRTACSLSALTGIPFHISNIRGGREEPGLKSQHLACVNGVASQCNAEVQGAALGSTDLKFIPGRLHFSSMNLDIGTAGSVTLLLQAMLPIAIFSDKKLHIKVTGGTDVANSPGIDYFINVFLPHIKRFADVEIEIQRRGYYPAGQGIVVLRVSPKYSMASFESFAYFHEYLLSERIRFNIGLKGSLVSICGISHASKELLNREVAERQAKSARYALGGKNAPLFIETIYSETSSPGSVVSLWAKYSLKETFDGSETISSGAGHLGERNMKAEDVGRLAAESLLKTIRQNSMLDEHLADQLLIYLALAGGTIRVPKKTSHLKTNIEIINRFFGKIKIKGNEIRS